MNHVRGTRELLELASGFKQLKAFVHVSTAFCNMENFKSREEILDRRIEERLYKNVDDWKAVIKTAEKLDTDTMNKLTMQLVLLFFDLL